MCPFTVFPLSLLTLMPILLFIQPQFPTSIFFYWTQLSPLPPISLDVLRKSFLDRQDILTSLAMSLTVPLILQLLRDVLDSPPTSWAGRSYPLKTFHIMSVLIFTPLFSKSVLCCPGRLVESQATPSPL